MSWLFSATDMGTLITDKNSPRRLKTGLLRCLSLTIVTGLTVLGGEPFEPENQVALVPFLKRVKESYPDKTILVIFRICARRSHERRNALSHRSDYGYA